MFDAIMLVRNCEATLPKLLASIEGRVDSIIALIGGESTDNTEDILRVAGAHLHYTAWRNDFAAARNELFDVARAHGCKWVILFDGDDKLVELDTCGTVQYLESLGATSGMATVAFGELSWKQKRIFNLHASGQWRGRVHETYDDGGLSIYCPAVRIEHWRGDAQRDPRRNMRIFEQWFSEDPGSMTTHDVYNWGNELWWNQQPTSAIEKYKQVVADAQAWDDEKYFAYIRMGLCYDGVGSTAQTILCYVSATKIRPQWGDAYLYMSRWYYFQEAWEMSVLLSDFARMKGQGQSILPQNTRLFTSEQAMFDSYALGKLQRYEEAYLMALRGLEFDSTNPILVQNVAYYSDWLSKNGRLPK
jgi:glycosyltransferase involved in cell wall biosynthesis